MKLLKKGHVLAHLGSITNPRSFLHPNFIVSSQHVVVYVTDWPWGKFRVQYLAHAGVC